MQVIYAGRCPHMTYYRGSSAMLQASSLRPPRRLADWAPKILECSFYAMGSESFDGWPAAFAAPNNAARNKTLQIVHEAIGSVPNPAIRRNNRKGFKILDRGLGRFFSTDC